MVDDGITRQKATGRGLKILLVLSLAMNVAVVGLVAGAVVRNDGWPERGKRPPALNAFGAPYMLALPRDDRRQIFTKLRSELGRDIPDRQHRRAQYAEVLNALRAQPFDVAVLAQAVRQQAETTVSVQKAGQGAWLELVSDMTDQERMDYAYAVEEILRRGPKGRK